MQFMLLVLDRVGAPKSDRAQGAISQFADELSRQGTLKEAMSLHPHATAALVQVRDGKAVVTEGGSRENAETIVAALAIETKNRAEAIDITKRCAAVSPGAIEVRLLPDRDVARSGRGKQFAFLLHMVPDLDDADGGKYREMIAYDDVLKREGSYLESSQLALDPPGARVETRGGEIVVTDGPFAETKEVTGGYYVVEAADRAEAIEIAKRCPHAKWGSVEVRQLR